MPASPALKIEFVIRRPRTGDRKKSHYRIWWISRSAPPMKKNFSRQTTGNSLNGLPNNTLKKPGKVIYSFPANNYFNGLLTGDLNHVCNLRLINRNTIFSDNWRSSILNQRPRPTPADSTPRATRCRCRTLCFYGPPNAGFVEQHFLFLRNSPPAKQFSKWISNSAKAAKPSSSKKTEKTAPSWLRFGRSGHRPEPEDNDSSLHLLKIDFYLSIQVKAKVKQPSLSSKKIAKLSSKKRNF